MSAPDRREPEARSATRRGRRVLAAFEPATASAAAISLAVDIASSLGADLVAVFVEDEQMLGVATLSAAREVRMLGGAAVQLDRGRIEREVHGLEARARRQLGEQAAARGVRWTFRVVRGSVPVEVAAAAAAEQADLVIVETSTRPLASGLRLRSQARSTVAHTAQPVMLVPPREDSSRGVAAVWDLDDEVSRNVVRTAATLAHTSGTELRVFAAEPTEATRRGAEPVIASTDHALVSWWPLPHDGSSAVARLLRTMSGTLVIGARSAILLAPDAWGEIERATCRVVVVR